MNTEIDNLLARIRSTPGCSVFPSAGLPNAQHQLPVDVVAFYESCGGCELFGGSDYAFRVVHPASFQPANPVIVGEVVEDDRSAWWYIVGQGGGQEYVSIDLHPSRLGRCYDSFWDRHAVAGSSPIIAASFTDLLTRMLTNGGDYWYWLRADFEAPGDAYDGDDD